MLHYVSTEGEVKISVGIKTRVLRSLISQKTDEMTVFFELLEAQADEETMSLKLLNWRRLFRRGRRQLRNTPRRKVASPEAKRGNDGRTGRSVCAALPVRS